MIFQITAFVIIAYLGFVDSHDARPPGIPPANPQHMHGMGQPPGQGQGQNLQYQAGQQPVNTGQQFANAQGNVQNMQQQQQYQGQQQQQHQGQQQQFQGQQQPGHGFRQHSEVHNKEHIKEHLKEVIDKPKDQMTDEELEFHYFKLHDYDGNNKLDGTEITKAITHFHDDHEEEPKEGEEPKPRKVFSDEELVNIVDLVLKEDDLDNDGYIEYAEFVTAQRKASDDKKDS